MQALTRGCIRRAGYLFAVAGLLFLGWPIGDVAACAFATVIFAALLRSVADPIHGRMPVPREVG